MNTLSAARRATRDRIKTMIAYHVANVSTEFRPFDFAKLNRIGLDSIGGAVWEMVEEGTMTQGGTYLVAGPKGYESHYAFVAVAPVEVDINVRFVETFAAAA